MSPLKITLRPPRTYVFGHRLHHAWAGLVLIVAGVGVVLSDIKDRHVWLVDLLVKHPDAP